MEITNELLAAYAEGNVTPEERKAVREYLTEHPSQLESVMMMMDEDYGMEVKPHSKDISFKCLMRPRQRDLSFASAAFVPSVSHSSFGMMEASMCEDSASFGDRLGDLLDEIY